MKRQHCNKFILSMALVTVLFISINVIAFANPFAAGIDAALGASGIDIAIGGTGAAGNAYNEFYGGNSDPVADFSPLSDYSVYYQKNYTTKTEGGETVSYDLVWCSHAFAEYFQNEGIALQTEYGIIPNATGTLSEGVGYYDGLPLYRETGQTTSYTSNYWFNDVGTFTFGSRVVVNTEFQSTPTIKWRCEISSLVDPETYLTIFSSNTHQTLGLRYQVSSSNYVRLERTYGSSWGFAFNTNEISTYLNLTPFNFTYTSGNIDNTPVGANYGVQFLIPSTYSQGVSGTYNLSQHENTIRQIFTDAGTAGKNNKIENAIFAPSPVAPTPTPPPTPTPTPLPTDPISEVSYDTLIGDISNVVDEQTEDITDVIGLSTGEITGAIDTVGQSIEDKLDDVADSVNDTIGLSTGEITGAIDTAGQSIEEKLDDVADSISDLIGLSTTTIVGWLRSILSAIEDGVLDIVDAIEGIAEAVLEAIESFFVTLFGDIQSAFGGWIADISDAFGIWHYVVEWLSCISTYFTFLRTIASGMPSCFWSPVLALVAGTIVLGVYKRFLQ